MSKSGGRETRQEATVIIQTKNKTIVCTKTMAVEVVRSGCILGMF